MRDDNNLISRPARANLAASRLGAVGGGDFPWGLFEGEQWMGDALCPQTDPEAFFPEKGGTTRDAKKICASCDVKAQCLEYALEHQERFGIWGGLSERERRKLLRNRATS